MDEQKIKDAYESIQPDQEEKYLMLKSILSVASDPVPVRKDVTMKTRSFRRSILLAAVICVIVMLSVASYAYGLFDLQDLMIEKETELNEIGKSDFLVYQGLRDSNAVKGAMEWMEFCDSYDPHYEIYDTVEDTCMEDFGDYYITYGCYTQEMVDELERICEKYGLTLHGKLTMVQREEGGERIYQSVGIETIYSDSNAENNPISGYYYEDGSFHFDGETRLNREDLPWKKKIEFQFSRIIKNSLDTVQLRVGDAESYEQWRYRTENGVELLLAIGPGKGIVIAELEESIVTINVLNVDDSHGEASQRSLEAFAETFDFTKIP